MDHFHTKYLVDASHSYITFWGMPVPTYPTYYPTTFYVNDTGWLPCWYLFSWIRPPTVLVEHPNLPPVGWLDGIFYILAIIYLSSLAGSVKNNYNRPNKSSVLSMSMSGILHILIVDANLYI
jgi:hypothetical protein